MTTSEGGDQDQQPPIFLPNSLDMARVIAAVTGDERMNPDEYFKRRGLVQIGYQVASNQLHSGLAVVHLEFTGQDAPDDPGKNTDRIIREVAVGHYRPGSEDWAIYDEYMADSPYLSDNLFQHFDSQSRSQDEKFRAELEKGQQFVDLRNPQTANTRYNTATALKLSGLDANLIIRDPYRIETGSDGQVRRLTVGFDAATTAYMTLAPQFSERQLDREIGLLQDDDVPLFAPARFLNTLNVVWDGAKFSDGTHSFRDEHVVTIAIQESFGIWIPNLNVLAMSEWQKIKEIPALFAVEKSYDGRFLADRCAFGYNLQDTYAEPT